MKLSSAIRKFVAVRAFANRWFAGAPALTGYWLTRFVILRLLGLVYFVAFLVAANQLVPLVGTRGLLPADSYLRRLAEHFGSRWEGFVHVPTLFWIGISDRGLVAVAWLGAALSLAVLLGYANAIVLLLLWALYLSIVSVGQLWYGYGWEIQLLETGFLAIFLCPLLDGRPFPRRAPPVVVLWLFRWLIFRIMLGAGLIKLRGDACWRDLTCLYFHYETQPIPSPLSWWLHFRPHWFQQFGTLWNHFIELVVPWFAFGPRPARHVAGILLTSFQVFLIVSGNLSFLNWLTIVPCLACLDDTFWSRLLPRFIVERAVRAVAVAERSRPQEFAALALAGVVVLLSIEPVSNLISPRQVMNTSFNRLNLVNTYGAFGSVGRERNEIVFEGTTSLSSEFAVWTEYEFKAKPGNPRRAPSFIAPYQCRIDWQIWFAAMSTPGQYPWTIHFVWKLLHNDPGTLSLLENNPFPKEPPRFVRAVLYRYRFTRPDESDGSWWKREPLGLWLPPLSADNPELRRFLTAQGWLSTEEEDGKAR
ncbi:MAG: hypothetical protein QOE70_5225 [Chthoniobacter sp.]|jgi:hypothetical protein|nr:hypothetical protein [Chthoniobacter sp.]